MQLTKAHIETLSYLIDLDITGSEHLIQIRECINESINERVLTHEDNTYYVIYVEPKKQPLTMSHWLVFNCLADDDIHAKEQCENAYPNCIVLHVEQTTYWGVAIKNYELLMGPLPEWATGFNYAKEIMVGTQLLTKDGRKTGNAYVIRRYINSQDIWLILTDAGNIFIMNELEINSQFYIGNYLSTSKGL